MKPKEKTHWYQCCWTCSAKWFIREPQHYCPRCGAQITASAAVIQLPWNRNKEVKHAGPLTEGK